MNIDVGCLRRHGDVARGFIVSKVSGGHRETRSHVYCCWKGSGGINERNRIVVRSIFMRD